jgi:hypothetical protein
MATKQLVVSCDLFYDTINISDCVTLKRWNIEKSPKENTSRLIEIISRYLPRRTEKKHKNQVSSKGFWRCCFIMTKQHFFWAMALLRSFCRISYYFYFFYTATTNFSQSKIVSLTSNLQPRGPGPCIYIPQWKVGSVESPGTGFAFLLLLRLVGLRWSYFNPPPHGEMMICNTRNYYVLDSVHRPAFCREHNVLKTGFVSVLRWGEEHQLCWVNQKELNAITGQLMSVQLQLYCINTWDKALSMGDNRKMYNNNCDKAFTGQKVR